MFKICLALVLLALAVVPAAGAFNPAYVPSLLSVFSSADEARIVKELGSRNLRSATLGDACLVASGAVTPADLARYRQRYQEILAGIRGGLSVFGLPPLQKAKKLHELIFDTVMKAYHSEQTTLLEVLAEGNFNCVSATLLYNLLATEFALATRVVAVPAHVYSQVKIGEDWIDIETTSRAGFNPLRDRSLPADGERAYIEDKGRGGNKLVIDTQRLVALLYYNRGTLAHAQGRYADAAGLLLRALFIFPEHRESQDNFLASMIDWAKKENTAGNTGLALKICDETDLALGARQEMVLLRENLVLGAAEAAARRNDFPTAVSIVEQYLRTLRQRLPQHDTALRGYLLQWAQQLLLADRYDEMLRQVDRAAARGQDTFVDSMRLHLVTEAAKRIAKKDGFGDGYAFYDKNYPQPLENAAIQGNRLHIYSLWINDRIDAGQFEEAYRLNRDLVRLYPGNADVRNNAAWVIQRWMASHGAGGNSGQSLPVMMEMYRKYKEPVFLQELVNGTLRESNRLQQGTQYQRAEALVRSARALELPAETAKPLDEMHRLILFNWSVFHARRDEYGESIEIGRRALKLFPKDRGLETNLVSFYYNAGLALINTRQYDRALRLLNEGLAEFPGNANLTKLKSYVE